ncbi:N-acetylglucosamine-6-phosphate deacetylase [Vibrio barjaei]|uniref:N-acetylglucosamine-6-phosphate deacetylase n=1 Tax=Vibrio barjaei TaxID=1676683 RepID=UPI002284D5B2|nr:N-acetylglucosamine-6-phosphate deacetylase [Vibrio barjaei]MCY9873748.1 N-acetylglucosamine-6-phosphate deacetylase [Vibrio barjaei]
MRTAFTANQIVVEGGMIPDGYVIVEDGVIIDIVSQRPGDCDVIHQYDGTIAPGLIDIHIHGRVGFDVMDATPEALSRISRDLCKIGVTGWVATTVTDEIPNLKAALKNVDAYIKVQPKQEATILGSFLEGPFLNCAYRGAHPEQLLIEPHKHLVDDILAASGSTLKRVAIAPELPYANEAIRRFRESGVKVAAAHTNANFSEMATAYNLGVDCGVHLFNGMSPLHHREPGCAGAVLYLDMLAEIIADGIHVNEVVLNLAYRMKGYKKMALVSDCMRAGGLSDGEYKLGSLDVIVKGGITKTQSGSLAGSTCELASSIKKMVKQANVPLWEAIQMATSVPAKYMDAFEVMGSVSIGKRANLAIFDKNLDIVETVMNGEIIIYD